MVANGRSRDPSSRCLGLPAFGLRPCGAPPLGQTMRAAKVRDYAAVKKIQRARHRNVLPALERLDKRLHGPPSLVGGLNHNGSIQARPDGFFIGAHRRTALFMLFDFISSSHCADCCGSAASAATTPVDAATAWSRPASRPAT
jgi:hypothetical protein